jgi:hypothetical protein
MVAIGLDIKLLPEEVIIGSLVRIGGYNLKKSNDN